MEVYAQDGRYDNLAEYYTDKKLPGVGISIGLSRLFFQLVDNNIINADNESISDIMVLSMDKEYNENCIEVATKLRENNLNVQINLEDQKVKNKFKYADKLKVKFIIIIGEDEVKLNKVTLKDMMTGKQDLVDIDNVIEIIKNN